MPDWLLVQIFYNALHKFVKILIDAATDGALTGELINEAK